MGILKCFLKYSIDPANVIAYQVCTWTFLRIPEIQNSIPEPKIVDKCMQTYDSPSTSLLVG